MRASIPTRQLRILRKAQVRSSALLDDPVDVVAEALGPGAQPAAVDLVVVGGQILPEGAAREDGHVLVQDMREVVDRAVPHQHHRLADHLRVILLSAPAWSSGRTATATAARCVRLLDISRLVIADHSDDQVVSKEG
jgi:hypothetical protein